MADFTVLGHIEGIRYLDKTVVVIISERSLAYKRKDGTKPDDIFLTWRVYFKQYFKKFIAEHFSSGMLVKIKGRVLPYAKDLQGEDCNGYTVLGETINLSAYPSNNLKREKKLVKDSILHDFGAPDVEKYNEPDF